MTKEITPAHYNINNICNKMLIYVSAIACLLPAIVINISAHNARGGSEYEVILYIMGVVGAAGCAHSLGYSLKNKSIYIIFISSLLLGLALTFNFINAVGSARLNRAEYSEPRLEIISRKNELEKEKSYLFGLLGNDYNPYHRGQIEAEIKKLKSHHIFTRSKECRDITLEESRNHCGKLFDALGKLKRIEAEEKTSQRLEAVKQELQSLPTTPLVVDPKVDSTIAVLSELRLAGEEDRARIGLIMDLVLAFFVELLAAFGPTIFIYMLSYKASPQSKQIKKRPETDIKAPITPELKMPKDIREFLETRVTVRRGARTSTEEIKQAFNITYPDRVKPISSAQLGRYVRALYSPLKDMTQKTAVYLDIELLPENVMKLRA